MTRRKRVIRMNIHTGNEMEKTVIEMCDRAKHCGKHKLLHKTADKSMSSPCRYCDEGIAESNEQQDNNQRDENFSIATQCYESEKSVAEIAVIAVDEQHIIAFGNYYRGDED